MRSSSGQPQNAFGEDVPLDLVGARVDRTGEGEKVAVQPSAPLLGIGGSAVQQAAFGGGGGHRDPPALTGGAEHQVVGDEEAVEEEFGEPVLTVELGYGPDGHAGQGEHEVGQPPVPGRGGVAAEQPEAPVRVGGPGAPGLLPMEPPA